MIAGIIITNQLFYWQKTLLVICLVSLLFFLSCASVIFTNRIKDLANKPLDSLETEIILQKENVNKTPKTVRTKGNILPFNLGSFSRQTVTDSLKNIKEIQGISTALVFWQFDLTNTITVIGIKVDEPPVGLRKISSLLMPGSSFFVSDSAHEVLLERHFSRLFGFKAGGMYRLGNEEYRIAGIVDFKEQSNLTNAEVFMPYETAMHAVGVKERIVNQVYVSLKKASLLESVRRKIGELLPGFSVITKDRLLANLSNLNRMFYKFGDYVSMGISLIACLLIIWILKMYRLEYRDQKEILKILGWPKRSLRRLVFIDISTVLIYACLIASVFLLIFTLFIIPQIKIDSLLNQGFNL